MNEREVVLLDIVQSNCCYYNFNSGCEKDLEVSDDAVCGKCIAEARTAIIRNVE